ILGGKQGFLHVFEKREGRYTEVAWRQIYDGPPESQKYVYTKNNNGEMEVHCPDQGMHHLMSGAVYWESSAKGRLIYVSVESDAIKAFRFQTGGAIFLPYENDLLLLNRNLPLVMRTSQQILEHPAANLSLSANKNRSGTGILWAVHADRPPLPKDPF